MFVESFPSDLDTYQKLAMIPGNFGKFVKVCHKVLDEFGIDTLTDAPVAFPHLPTQSRPGYGVPNVVIKLTTSIPKQSGLFGMTEDTFDQDRFDSEMAKLSVRLQEALSTFFAKLRIDRFEVWIMPILYSWCEGDTRELQATVFRKG